MVNNQELFNNLQIYDTVLQLMTFIQTAGDPSNAEIIKELQAQNNHYLEKIIEQNNKIISMLDEKSKSTP